MEELHWCSYIPLRNFEAMETVLIFLDAFFSLSSESSFLKCLSVLLLSFQAGLVVVSIQNKIWWVAGCLFYTDAYWWVYNNYEIFYRVSFTDRSVFLPFTWQHVVYNITINIIRVSYYTRVFALISMRRLLSHQIIIYNFFKFCINNTICYI